MLNINLNKKEKYCFIINNTFSILYFLSIRKTYNITKSVFIINNTNNFFTKGDYKEIFKKENIKYIILNGENFFRNFPYSIIDIINYKKDINKKLSNISKYNLIVSQDSLISNNLILNYLKLKNNNFLLLIDTTIYSIIKNNKFSIKYLLYKYYLKLFGIKRGIKSGLYFKYDYKIYYNTLDKTVLSKNINYLKNMFSCKLNMLNKIFGDKNVVFLSQNIIDGKKITKEIFIKKIKKIEEFYKDKGYSFYIKPHPMENISYYKKEFNIIDKFIPSELLDIYFGKKDTIYITFFSTVITNLNFGKKYLIGDIGFGNNEKEIIKLLNKDFNTPFLNYE